MLHYWSPWLTLTRDWINRQTARKTRSGIRPVGFNGSESILYFHPVLRVSPTKIPFIPNSVMLTGINISHSWLDYPIWSKGCICVTVSVWQLILSLWRCYFFLFFLHLDSIFWSVSPLWGESQAPLLRRHAHEVKKKKKPQPKPNGEPNPRSQRPGTSEREQRLLGRCHHHQVWRGCGGMKADSEQILLRWFIDHQELSGDNFRCVSNHTGSLIIMLLGCLVSGILGNLSPWGLIFSQICSAVYSVVVLFFHLLHSYLIWRATSFPIPFWHDGAELCARVHPSDSSWAQLTVLTIHSLYIFK